MGRKGVSEFPIEVLNLFDQYVHGIIDRRGFLDQAGKLVGGVAAADLLEALNPNFAEAEQISMDDPRIQAQTVEYPSPEGYGTVHGYRVQPAHKQGKLPAVLVVHENRGLNPHIEDIARRLALEKFIAFAPDALAPLGGYPGDEDRARERFSKIDQTKAHGDFVAAAQALRSLPDGNGRVGVVGFCYGGGIANFLATKLPDLDAVVSFYGLQPALEEVAKIKAPLLIH